jgi:hypothetical protein
MLEERKINKNKRLTGKKGEAGGKSKGTET